MGLLPAAASFEEQVADYFALVRGHGLMLSPLDRELLTGWAEVGAPFEVVARGIRRAAEKAAYDARPGSTLRSLRACRREVDSEIKKFLARSAGRTDGALEDAAPVALPSPGDRIARALRGSVARRPELAGVLTWLGAVGPVAQLEDRVVARILRSLPWTERVQLYREARTSAAIQTGISARARKLSLRVHRAAALRRGLELPAFW